VFDNKRILAVILARAGSKGLPSKNIKSICGKPLIAWSIEVGLNSIYIDEVMVSTDCPLIAEVARKHGASTPFIRPSNLATDESTSFDAIHHTIDFYKQKLKKEFDYLVLLEPTSPLRTSKDVDCAIEMLINSGRESIVGICKTESQNPAFLVVKDKQNLISGYLNKEIKVIRRQEIEDIFFLEGTVYISKVKTYMEKKTFYHQSTIGYEVEKFKSLEIDDMDDFVMVEAIMKHKGY
jgi:CMP-N,N'-diacetyllegionaminic acid synthase